MGDEPSTVQRVQHATRHFAVGSRTDVGRRRSENQDRLSATARLLAVADGVGGSEGGAEAATAAIRALEELLAASGEMLSDPASTLPEVFLSADAEIREAATSHGWTSSGTTLTCVVWTAGSNPDGPPRLAVGHIGDSRAYLLRDDVLHPLTDDHVVPVERPDRPPLLALARCLGGGVMGARPDLSIVDTHPGDRLLLCSDGLTKELPDVQIRTVLGHVASAQETCEHLVDSALANGGRDNITVVVADVL